MDSLTAEAVDSEVYLWLAALMLSYYGLPTTTCFFRNPNSHCHDLTHATQAYLNLFSLFFQTPSKGFRVFGSFPSSKSLRIEGASKLLFFQDEI